MDPSALAVIGALAAVIFVLVVLLVTGRRRQETGSDRIELALEQLKRELLEKQLEGLISLRDSLDNTGRLMNERLAEGSAAIDKRMALLVDIENRLGQLQTQAENIETVGRNIQSLSELLKPPKLRGGLGEMLLENLLAQILPRALYETQYRFSTGQRVDAVVKLADRLLPIDSKFPIESFERLGGEPDAPDARKTFVKTLRKHIDDISQRYIRPDENTFEIAVMYLPSEAIYYRFVSDDSDDGLGYALSKHVIPSSPGHLYAFLATLSAVYAQAGLSSDSRKLTAGLSNLSDAVERLKNIHQRMEGSVRALTTALARGQDEVSGMTTQLEHLREPSIQEDSGHELTEADSSR